MECLTSPTKMYGRGSNMDWTAYGYALKDRLPVDPRWTVAKVDSANRIGDM